jgi:hypothetical protein
MKPGPKESTRELFGAAGVRGRGRGKCTLTVMCCPSIFTETPCGMMIGTLPMRLSFGVSCFRATH